MLLKSPLTQVMHIALQKQWFSTHFCKHLGVVSDCYIATVGDDGKTVCASVALGITATRGSVD